MKKQLLALSFMLVAGAVAAQTAPAQPVAKIVATDGLVTIGYRDTMSSAAVDMRLFEGSRVMTTTTGSVDIVFDTGCRVALKPGEVFSVSDANCKALLASRAAALKVAGVAGVAVVAGAGAGAVPVVLAAGANTVLMGAAATGLGIIVAGEKQSGS